MKLRTPPHPTWAAELMGQARIADQHSRAGIYRSTYSLCADSLRAAGDDCTTPKRIHDRGPVESEV